MEFIMARQWILFLTAGLVLVATPGLGDENADPIGSALTEAVAEADTRELFLRCCWAKGRAGFQYCVQYGICASDSKATCKGVGAAEGMSASCGSESPDLPEEGG
jgi:hypothetical protein